MSHDPTEHVREELHEHAEHEHGKGPRWIGFAALLAALLAALAAVGGSMASSRLTDSMRAQIKANDHWGEYQANSIKEKDLQTRAAVLAAQGKDLSAEEKDDLAKYGKRNEIKAKAEAKEHDSEHALETHETLEHGVTFFHVAIAIVAISVLTRRRLMYYAAMAVGAVGLVFFGMGLNLHFRGHQAADHAEPHGTAEHAPADHDAATGPEPAHSAGH